MNRRMLRGRIGTVATICTLAMAIPGLAIFDVVINPAPGLSSNAEALAAFNRAAEQWELIISDDIQVFIDADLTDLGSTTILGQASSVILELDYPTVQSAMISDAANEAEDALVNSLPTTLTATLPSDISLSGNAIATKANFKALNFSVPDIIFGVSDAEITFNSEFTFDYDNSNGITPGAFDFESVAMHEIGHALGFVSVVDEVQFLENQGGEPATVSPTPLDLFRFDDDTPGLDPANEAQFSAYPRNLLPGGDPITDFLDTEIPMSRGTDFDYQASHWADNQTLGLMDPTLAANEIAYILYNDALAMDLIGYEIDMGSFSAIPEPSSIALALIGGLMVRRLRRRRGRCR